MGQLGALPASHADGSGPGKGVWIWHVPATLLGQIHTQTHPFLSLPHPALPWSAQPPKNVSSIKTGEILGRLFGETGPLPSESYITTSSLQGASSRTAQECAWRCQPEVSRGGQGGAVANFSLSLSL